VWIGLEGSCYLTTIPPYTPLLPHDQLYEPFYRFSAKVNIIYVANLTVRLNIVLLVWHSSSWLFSSTTDLFPPTHFRFRGLLLRLIILNDKNSYSVWLLWTRDRPMAEAATWQHNTQDTDIHDSGGTRTRHPNNTHALDRAATGIGRWVFLW
jgi:hypothetical protein